MLIYLIGVLGVTQYYFILTTTGRIYVWWEETRQIAMEICDHPQIAERPLYFHFCDYRYIGLCPANAIKASKAFV